MYVLPMMRKLIRTFTGNILIAITEMKNRVIHLKECKVSINERRTFLNLTEVDLHSRINIVTNSPSQVCPPIVVIKLEEPCNANQFFRCSCGVGKATRYQPFPKRVPHELHFFEMLTCTATQLQNQLPDLGISWGTP